MRNMTFRHAREHDVYILETDGYVFETGSRPYYAGGYRVLTFVRNHGLIQNCEARATATPPVPRCRAPTRNIGRDTHVYPEARYSQEVRLSTPSQNGWLLGHQ